MLDHQHPACLSNRSTLMETQDQGHRLAPMVEVQNGRYHRHLSLLEVAHRSTTDPR